MGFLDFFKRNSGAPPDGKALCDAITAVASSDNEETRKNLYRALLKSWLHIPTPELPPEMRQGAAKLETGAKINFAHVQDRDGRIIFPAFTDAEALRNWDPNTPSFAMPAQEYFKIVTSLKVDEILINLYDPIRKPLRPGGSITRREFELLAQGRIPPKIGGETRVQAVTHVMIGKPANPLPETAQQRFQETCSKMKMVEAAYYAMAMFPPSPPEHTLGLIFRQGTGEQQKRECFKILGEAIRGVLPPNVMVSFIDAEDLLDKFRKSGSTLFQRRG